MKMTDDGNSRNDDYDSGNNDNDNNNNKVDVFGQDRTFGIDEAISSTAEES
jgi:hypothetical protein